MIVLIRRPFNPRKITYIHEINKKTMRERANEWKNIFIFEYTEE